MGRPLNKRFFDPVPSSNGEGVASYTITAPGSYAGANPAVPTVAVSAPGLPGGVSATLGTVTMKALSATVTTGGTGGDYNLGETLTVNGGTGTAPVFTVATVRGRALVVAAAGTNNTWTTGQTITFSGAGWSTPAVATITDNGAGGIASLAFTNKGVRTAANPTDPVSPSSTNNGGGLQGLTVNIDWEVNTVTSPPGTAGALTALPANPAATTVNAGSGTGATLTITYGVLSVAVTNAGSGYVSPTDAAIEFTPASTTAATAVLTTTGTNVILAHAWVVDGTQVLDADIIKQTSTNEYLMATTEGQSIVSLVASASPTEGQAYIKATDALGSTYFVTKLTAHLAVLERWTDGGSGFVYAPGDDAPWSFDISGDLEGQVVQIETA